MAFADPQSQRASSSSSSISTRVWNYDVFLSFMGEDTRHNFTDHLYRALDQKGIRTFRDDEELRRGEEIAAELLKAIEESRICVVILSKNYARSRWCLDELVKIMEWKQCMGQLVFPIFYQVDPSNVRKQMGSYGEALADHERTADEEGMSKIKRWREALWNVAKISGWCLRNGPESHVIEMITSTIWKSLNRELLQVEKKLVGMDLRRASSSSTSTCIGPWEYEVFLSFRGQDTRQNFTDHLYAALYQKGFRTFRVDYIRGEMILPTTLRAIEMSRCFLVILSKNYAHSKWCLDELKEIMESRRQMGKIVFPVFYHVNPSDVRNQGESYGEALANHERKIPLEYTQKLRAALREVGNLSGWHIQNGSPMYVLSGSKSEADFIEDITCVILMKFSQKLLQVDKNLIGMDYRLEEMEEIFPQIIDPLSNDVRMVGIYGFGGIGKTTMAKVLYNRIGAQFMIASFIANVREDSKSRGLLYLQKQLLHDILPRRKNFIRNVDEGVHMIKDRLCFKKVLLVLDDVDDLNQLEALAGDHSWFGPGSRIIVTTRDKHLLELHGMDALYEAKKLDHKEAIELFCWNAFKQNHPKEDYETLSNSVVHYVNGLPLGLKILGCFLYGKTIFLDIACFFNGEEKDFVTRILDACNFYAESGIGVLGDKCFVTILDNKIWMHDLLQQMGREIVRQECPRDPGKWSRLCYPEVVNRVLTRKMGTKAIEGILLNLSRLTRIHITTEAFAMMKNLRLLKIHWDLESASTREDNKVKLSKDFEFPSHELRYLHWHGYPLESLPLGFYAEDLVELDMCYSSLKRLWEGDLLLEKLNTIRVSCSQHLIEIPDITVSAPNLEKLILDGCSSLLEVHPSIGKLNKLILLNLKNCKKLICFPSIIDMKRLKFSISLAAQGSRSFQIFKNLGSLQRLAQLHADGTAIAQPPDSIVLLRTCNSNGIGLRLPSSFSSFRSKPEHFLSIPAGISELTNLKDLRLAQCQSLTGIPELPPSVRDIDAHNCTSLLPGSSSVSTLQGLQFLFYNCSKPVEDQSSDDKRTELQIFPHIYVSSTASDSSVTTSPVMMQKLLENIAFSIVFPGTGIPEWIWHQNVGSSIKIQLPTNWYSDDFLGFALCSVLEHLPERIICHLNSDVFNYGDLKDFGHDSIGQATLLGQNMSGWVINRVPTHRFNSSASNVVKKCGLREAVTEQDSIEVEWTLVLVAAVMDPPMIPRSSSSANVLKNDYHHPAFKLVVDSVEFYLALGGEYGEFD
ncbi:TMV resistance protein N [Vitis vinifera]|uniref:ADP-ribosyl cyclase/cyclic ADP-ribose hydrolase n=1 Tax=Vitis vinifera TaxID=29760 RepID=A0A438FY90_VITVI|nr:TMV resistance protein N [Vitis vinifera]